MIPHLVEVMNDPEGFGKLFQDESWNPWKAILKTLPLPEPLPLTQSELEIFQKVSGRNKPPQTVKEFYAVCGRGSGKSRIGTTICVFAAAFMMDYLWSGRLAPGQRVTFPVLAVDREQASESLNYAFGLFDEIPMLAALVERRVSDGIDLVNRASIRVKTSDSASVRGHTYGIFNLEELAHVSNAKEIRTSAIPALRRLPQTMFFGLSNGHVPYGLLYDMHRKHFGKEDSDVLVIQADTLTLNPSYDASAIEEFYEDDPVSGASEYGGLFRDESSAYVSLQTLESVIISGQERILPPAGSYCVGFHDYSHGRGDSAVSSVAFFDRDEGKGALIDYLETRPPFSPSSMIREHAAFFHSYNVSSIIADRANVGLPNEEFAKHGINVTISPKDKSLLYLDLLSSLNSGHISLPDREALKHQFLGLIRRPRPNGRDSIDHPSGDRYHDDIANSVTGALVEALKQFSFELPDVYRTRKNLPPSREFTRATYQSSRVIDIRNKSNKMGF